MAWKTFCGKETFFAATSVKMPFLGKCTFLFILSYKNFMANFSTAPSKEVILVSSTTFFKMELFTALLKEFENAREKQFPLGHRNSYAFCNLFRVLCFQVGKPCKGQFWRRHEQFVSTLIVINVALLILQKLLQASLKKE